MAGSVVNLTETLYLSEAVASSYILKKRSKKYLDLIAGLDAKTLTDTKGMDDLMKAILDY